MSRPRVVVIGAGFGGLTAARVLAKAPVELTVVDRANHHTFQPLLYQVASAGLSPADIAMPVRSVLRNRPHARVLMAAVKGIDLDGRRVLLEGGDTLAYDRLILATGARHAYFGHPEWEATAPGLKTLEDATEIRRRILLAFERAEKMERTEGPTDKAEREALLTFVIVGAGPTGIELAGAIAELARYALARDFHTIDPTAARVVLVEAGPDVLAAFHPDLAPKARAALTRLGVQVRTGARVTAVDAAGVTFADGNRLATRTVIWAAGVAPSPLGAALGAPLDRTGRVLVNPDLSVPGRPEIQVIGDLAAVPWRHREDGTVAEWVPGMAPGAMQMGRHAARNVLAALRGAPTTPFRYVHKGMMATVGRAAAVVDFAGIRMNGPVAWLTWLFVHILYLIGFRNRLLVLIQWTWSYLTFQRGTRLITEPWRPMRPRV